MHLGQVFAGPGVDVVMPQFGFAVYAIAAQAVGATLRVAPALPADARMPRGHDLEAIAAAITPATRLVYLAHPYNPTSTWFSRHASAAFVARVPDETIDIVDQAYAAIAAAPAFGPSLPLLRPHPHPLVT